MMQEAEGEALLSTQPLLAFWSSSSPVTVVLRPRPRQHFSSGGDGKEGKSAGAAGCSMKQVGFSTQTRKWTVLYKPRYSFSEY